MCNPSDCSKVWNSEIQEPMVFTFVPLKITRSSKSPVINCRKEIKEP